MSDNMDQDLNKPFLLIEERTQVQEENQLEEEEKQPEEVERAEDNRWIDQVKLVEDDGSPIEHSNHSEHGSLRIVEETFADQDGIQVQEVPVDEEGDKQIEEDIQVDVEEEKQFEGDIQVVEEKQIENEGGITAQEAMQVIEESKITEQAQIIVAEDVEEQVAGEEQVIEVEQMIEDEQVVIEEKRAEEEMSVDDLNNKEHVVEKILDKKNDGGLVYYLVKWEGYPSSENTWEPLENLDSCEETMRKFEEIRAQRLANKYGGKEISNNMIIKNKTVSRHKEYMLDSILGLTKIDNEKYFLISLKDYNRTTFVRASLANKMFPDKVIAFYLKHMQWKKVS